MTRRITLMLIMLAAIFSVTLVAPAQADEQVDDIIAKVKKLNPGLQDYQANINVQIHAKVSFLPYNTTVAGKYFHKTPDKHKLVVEKAPSYVKKYPNIFGFSLPKVEKFNSCVQDTTTINGRQVYHIAMLPKVGMGDIERVDLWVDTQNFTVPRQTTSYKNNGKLNVDVVYRQDHSNKRSYWVFDTMSASFEFPKVFVSAKANATYSNYVFNQALSDAFFAQK